jgi:hypothetical protein
MLTRLADWLSRRLKERDFARLLRRAQEHVMTKGELERQRRSWVIGELLLSNPHLTRQQAELLYDEVFPCQKF